MKLRLSDSAVSEKFSPFLFVWAVGSPLLLNQPRVLYQGQTRPGGRADGAVLKCQPLTIVKLKNSNFKGKLGEKFKKKF